MSPPPPPDRTHFRRLDGVRGLAILMVLAFHCLGQTYRLYQLPWPAGGLLATTRGPVPRSFLLLYPVTWGWAGVAVFFVLSGFVIHHAQLRAGGRLSLGTFAVRRACRIYPPYLLALVAFTTVAWFTAKDRHGVVRQFAYHAALLHNLRADTFNGLDGSFWSLAVEAQFYALYPVLWWARRWGGPAAPLLVALTASAGAWDWAAVHTRWRATTDLPTFVWWNTLPLWFSWAVGMFLADRFAAGRRAFGRPGLWGPLLVVAFAASTFAKPTWAVVSFTLAAGAAAVSIEAVLWSPRHTAWLGHWLLVTAGLCSYSFYLWHQPLLAWIDRGLGLPRLPPAVRFPVLTATAALAVGGLSWTLFLAVERPSQWLGKRLAPR